MKTFDILIIGNGVLGLSAGAALTFQDPTVSIGIIGPYHRKSGATLAAGAMLGAFGEVTEATLDSEYGRYKLDISYKALQYWDEWLEKITTYSNMKSLLSIQKGTHILLNTRSANHEDNNFNAIIQALNEYKEPYEEVSPQKIKGFNPVDNSRALRSIFIPNEGSIDPSNLLSCLENIILKNKKSKLVDDKVISIKKNDYGTFTLITEKNETFQAKKIVMAAGAHTQVLLNQLPDIRHLIPKILSGAGTSFTLNTTEEFPDSVIRSPNRAGACGMHLIPTENSIYIGASNAIRIFPQTQSRLRDQYYLIQRSIEQFQKNFHSAEIKQWYVGNRPFSLDSFPLIGKTSIPGLFVLSGTYRDGIHQSPILAEWIADEVLTGNTTKHPFIPERRPLQTLNRQETILAFTRQYYGTAYEHDIQLPKMGWEELIETSIHTKANMIYDQLGIDIGIPIDLLFMLFHEPQHIPYIKNLYQSHEHQTEKTYE